MFGDFTSFLVLGLFAVIALVLVLRRLRRDVRGEVRPGDDTWFKILSF